MDEDLRKRRRQSDGDQEADTTVPGQLTFGIPNDVSASFVIGSRGASVMAMQDATGCKVDIRRDPGHDGPRACTISGGIAADRARCLEMVRSRVAEGRQVEQSRQRGSAGQQGAPLMLDIPNDGTVNFLIGKGGCSVNELQTSTGTRVVIQKVIGPFTDTLLATGLGDALNRMARMALSGILPSPLWYPIAWRRGRRLVRRTVRLCRRPRSNRIIYTVQYILIYLHTSPPLFFSNRRRKHRPVRRTGW